MSFEQFLWTLRYEQDRTGSSGTVTAPATVEPTEYTEPDPATVRLVIEGAGAYPAEPQQWFDTETEARAYILRTGPAVWSLWKLAEPGNEASDEWVEVDNHRALQPAWVVTQDPQANPKRSKAYTDEQEAQDAYRDLWRAGARPTVELRDGIGNIEDVTPLWQTQAHRAALALLAAQHKADMNEWIACVRLPYDNPTRRAAHAKVCASYEALKRDHGDYLTETYG